MNSKYLSKLKEMYLKLDDEMEKIIFQSVLSAYFFHLQNGTSKYVSKQVLLEKLVKKGLLSMKYDKASMEYKLPDDRALREAARELLKKGYPILTSSKHNGYYITDSVLETEKLRLENHSRAVSVLAADKGYKRVKELLEEVV